MGIFGKKPPQEEPIYQAHGLRNEQTMCTDWPVMWF
jgi:hypothetical protein